MNTAPNSHSEFAMTSRSGLGSKRSQSPKDSKKTIDDVKPDKGITIPGIGWHATLAAKYKKEEASQY